MGNIFLNTVEYWLRQSVSIRPKVNSERDEICGANTDIREEKHLQ